MNGSTPSPLLPPGLRLPSIDALLAFEAAARLASLERAAEELHISASAVGKRIAGLEELLGAPLLTRSAKPLALTAAGKEYLQQIGGVLAALAAMPQHRRAAQTRPRLRISCPPTFARQILVPALPDFGARHPEIELELVLSIPFLDERAPEAELEIRNQALEQEGQVLLHDRVTPMAAPALLQRLPPLDRPAALRAAPLLRTPLQPWAPWLRQAGLDWPEPDRGTRFVDLGLTLEAAACGQGVALARPSLALPYLRRGDLRLLFPGLGVPAAQPYGLLQHDDGAPAEAFAAWLFAHCRALEEEVSALA
ncbi:LysR family transcriptional regulator [Roseateles sp. DAIF2]|uniref:LysR substrate-binding domain-containing protein n=1 Tax=Roseateles sp. DAIF2 TaxID=2714952 RepID=UPI0018A2C2FF|nr:LysR substrate-binding domain-containing protein [Roseateles sp. DAIF2]QPF74735.1 LysR family transcriptional regulator [Roseateles sp. DAIF2]